MSLSETDPAARQAARIYSYAAKRTSTYNCLSEVAVIREAPSSAFTNFIPREFRRISIFNLPRKSKWYLLVLLHSHGTTKIYFDSIDIDENFVVN